MLRDQIKFIDLRFERWSGCKYQESKKKMVSSSPLLEMEHALQFYI